MLGALAKLSVLLALEGVGLGLGWALGFGLAGFAVFLGAAWAAANDAGAKARA